ncbi:MAG: ribbon-helix-helix protein, CopG family [Clostridiales bacterium]|nr:ribbon-helix-helix protein, CopG family [Clostridiales bacterium]
MSISVRLSKAEADIIKKYAELKGMTVSDLVRRSVLERIEDEHDLAAYHKAMAAFKKDPVTYTLHEVEKELGLQ